MENLSHQYRVWAEVNLDHLLFNYKQMQQRAGNTPVMPVLKADSYGHGAITVAKALSEAGARRFAVVTQEEALQLRKNGIEGTILLLGVAPPASIPALQEAGIHLCVPSLDIAKAYVHASNGKPLSIHLKLDTGMSRLGMTEENAVQDSLAISQLPNIRVEGIFTQFSSSDLPGEDSFTQNQYKVFRRVIDALERGGLSIPAHHCANSAATEGISEIREDFVRNGLSLYGYHSREEQTGLELRPVLSWGSSIVQCKEVPAGCSIGYDRGYRADGPKTVATVPVGYADGLQRVFSSGGGQMLVRGQKAPVIGKICMDMCMLDVTGIEGVSQGDLVTIIGKNEGAVQTADDVAHAMGTVSYEVLCGIGKRVPRLYSHDGQLDKDRPYWCGYL